jgi:hypothetical protein
MSQGGCGAIGDGGGVEGEIGVVAAATEVCVGPGFGLRVSVDAGPARCGANAVALVVVALPQ